MSKKILILTQYFYPENFRSSDLAFEMVKRGHEVTALVGIPNYPKGEYYEGYGIFKKRIETINGVKIYRAFQTPRGKRGKAFGVMLNYFTYVISATIDILFMCMFKKVDAIVVHETSPITQGIPAVIAKKLFGIPIYFWVLDLWPETLEAVNVVKNKKVIAVVDNLVKWIYKNSNKILISSKSFRTSICEKGDFDGKIRYFPNWVEDDLLYGNDIDTTSFGSKFVVMFAGNIGEAQDFDAIIKTAESLKDDENILFVIVGDGRKREASVQEVERLGLTNVHFTGQLPKETMPSMFSKADVMMVTLKDNIIFNMTVPAKLQAYMALAKPIVGMINGETAELIDEADCGYCVNASDSEAYAKVIRQLSFLNKDDLKQKGENGKSYYEKLFTKDISMDNFEKILNEKV